MKAFVSDEKLRLAAEQGADGFVGAVLEAIKEAAGGLRVVKFTPASYDAAETLARAMLALRLPVYAAVSGGDAANLKLVAESHGMEFEEV